MAPAAGHDFAENAVRTNKDYVLRYVQQLPGRGALRLGAPILTCEEELYGYFGSKRLICFLDETTAAGFARLV